MRRSNLTTFFYLVLVFISGAVVGGFAHRLYTMKSVSAAPDKSTQYLQEMRSRLHLSDAQVTELRQIMSATRQRFHESHRAIEDEHARQVFAMLNEDQKSEYAKMREEREKRRQQHAAKER